jgi:ubiquinone/menaquinone biosynthesis C-methylase UbiE
MRFEPESIPFPFSRLYLLAVARSAFFRDVYVQVARECSAELRSGAVLDVGCGPGDLALRLAELRPGLKVVGIDISADMVRLAARQAAASPHAARLRFERADAANLSGFPDASFEAAVSSISLHHWRRPERVLEELWRVLKPGGFALLADFDRDMPHQAIAASAHRYGPKMYLLHAAKRFEPFYGAAALGRLLKVGPFRPWRIERRGVLLWARAVKAQAA